MSEAKSNFITGAKILRQRRKSFFKSKIFKIVPTKQLVLMLFLRENSQRLVGFKFIECHWSIIRLIFIYFIKKGIFSAPPCPRHYRATGAAAPSAPLVTACLKSVCLLM